MFCSCRISTDKHVVQFLRHSRASCYILRRSGLSRHMTMPNVLEFIHPQQRYCDFSIFTARCYAKRAVVVCPSVCLSVCVCVCVTLRYSTKTAKRRITQIMPHDSPVTLVLLTPKFTVKFEWDHPLQVWQMQVEWGKIRHFLRKMRYNSKTVQDRHIVSINIE